MCNLGTYQITGENGFSIDVIQGVKWLSRSAQEATKEYPKGLYEYALLHENGLYPSLFKDHSFMISLLQEACRFDDPDAHIKCAQGYEAELWGLIRSPEDAIVHYQRAALKKHPEVL
jgi:TPR repeat protein